jgi:predicted ABC-type ATPase
MTAQPAHVVLVAGPNGAGKSTSAPHLVNELLGISTYVNADVIAQGLGDADSPKTALQAGRLMLARLYELSEAGKSFSFETTLASRTFAPWLKSLKEAHGYRISLFFFALPTVNDALMRVRDRVARGGHNVPEDVIGRRFHRGLWNFFEIYREIMDSWTLLNNSGPEAPHVVAVQPFRDKMVVHDSLQWEHFEKQAHE